MKNYLETIVKEFPIRNSEEQKEKFRTYVCKEAEACGYKVETEEIDNHKNILIGNTEEASCIFTAHYDTPRRSVFPNIMIPKNRFVFWLYQFAVIIPMILLSLLAAQLVFSFVPLDYSIAQNRGYPLLAFLVVYYTLFFIWFKGKPNKNNVNDNTSGVATVLELAGQKQGKDKVAFILFDDEEKGKKGSKAFAGKHNNIKENTPIFNFDCVGNGTNYVLIGSEKMTSSGNWNTLKNNFTAAGLNAFFFNNKEASANSDQKNFDFSSAVLACKKSKHGLLYTDRIHTKKDTCADSSNIRNLVEVFKEIQ